jgi:hypothetical protein
MALLPVRVLEFATLCAAVRVAVPATEVAVGSAHRAADLRVPSFTLEVANIVENTNTK